MEISGSPGRRGNTFRSDTGGRRWRKPPRTGSRLFPRSSRQLCIDASCSSGGRVLGGTVTVAGLRQSACFRAGRGGL